MIDLEREHPVTLRNAPQLVPTIDAVPGMDARPPLHYRTIYVWATKGRKGVILETVMVGGLMVTSREALVRFFNRLSLARDQRIHTPRLRTVRGRINHRARTDLARNHGI